MTDESRRASRRRLDQVVSVHDTVTEEVIGTLVNLSETGMSLIAHRPIANDALYQLRFALPGASHSPKVIDVGAHELWATDAAAPDQRWVGFRFIAVSSAHLGHIRDWVNEPGAELV